MLLITQCLRPANGEIAHSARARLAAKLLERFGELSIHGHLNTRRRHAENVPRAWYAITTLTPHGLTLHSDHAVGCLLYARLSRKGLAGGNELAI